MGAVSYLYDSPNIKWSCPDGTSSYALWSKTTPPGYDIAGKLSVGPGCTAEVTFSGTTGQFGGAVGPDGVTYGCSTNDGNDFVWYSLEGKEDWAYATLHKLIIKNSPLLGSSLFITNFAGLSREGGEGKTSLGPAGVKTVPFPTADAAYTSSIQAKASAGAASLKSSFASVSSVSLVSHLSRSLLADKTTASTSLGATQSTSNHLATTVNTAASTAGSSAVVDSKSFTTTTFVLISATVLAIIVVALIVAMCWNSSPKKDPASEIEKSLSAKHRKRRRRSGSNDSSRSDSSDGGNGDSDSDDGGGSETSTDEEGRRRRKGRAQRSLGAGQRRLPTRDSFPLLLPIPYDAADRHEQRQATSRALGFNDA